MAKIEFVKPPFRRLDAQSAVRLRAAVRLAWEHRPTIVALDLSDVAYVDSLGLSALVAEHRERPAGTTIIVFGLTDYVREVFEITRLGTLFDVYEDAAAVRLAHHADHAQAAV